VTMQKWGGLASFLMAAAFLVAPLIYLAGDLRHATGHLWAFWLGLLLRNPESDRTQSPEEANRQPFPT
jgi:hypothetical protein